MRTRTGVMAVLVLACSLLAGCQQEIRVPTDTGVCWHLVTLEDGKTRFNPMARGLTDIEHCAAALESMRLQFNRLGQNRDEVIGGYQGRFIWIEREGVFLSQTLNGTRFLALVRSGDGRLVTQGSMEQPPPAAALPAPTAPTPVPAAPATPTAR